jgi:hypothetical protein
MKIQTKALILSIILGLIIFASMHYIDAYEVHKQNTNLYYSFTSNNATQCNLTTGNTPNGLIEINQISSKNGQTFNNTILSGNFTTLGNYCYNIVCTDGIENVGGSVCKTINPNGIEMNGWKITLELFASLSTLFLAVLFFYFSGIGIKSKMAKEENGASKFLFSGLAIIFLVAHILITNVIIHETLGELNTIASAYTNVMYVIFTIIIVLFLYMLFKITAWEIDIFKTKKGLK